MIIEEAPQKIVKISGPNNKLLAFIRTFVLLMQGRGDLQGEGGGKKKLQYIQNIFDALSEVPLRGNRGLLFSSPNIWGIKGVRN
jgi:hypothetical protein